MSEIKTYVTHFCGVGGACWGLEQAGLECVSAIDWLDYAVEYRYRNLGHKAICGDIVEYEPGKKEAADLLWTSPPCQTFSTCAREWAQENKEDRRNVLFLNSVHYLKKLRPRFVVLENVMGLGSHEADNSGHGTLDTMMNAIKAEGYHVECNVLDAKDFGVPQTRPRIFIVGSRDGEKGLIPVEPQDVEPARFASIMEHGLTELGWGAETYKTALMKVKRLAEKHGSFKITVVGPDDILPTMTCGWGGGATRKKVAIIDETVEGMAFLRHPSVREGARAQGFPDTWEFPSSKTRAWTLIGNAVASPVARAIAEHLRAISRGERPTSKWLLDARLPKYVADAGDAPPVWLSREAE